jgi:class 3 adenylate cyclase
MSEPITRNLVILLTDIKGFTDRTSHQSRAEIQQLLERHKEIVLPVLQGRGGTLVKTMGDAFLMTYESPTNAVLAGIDVQAALGRFNRGKSADERIEVRVAINQGEVNLADNDVFGEAVNITARIEAIADAGDVFFTEGVYLAMNKKEVPSSEVGLLQLKGIPEKIRVYKVKTETPARSLADAAPSGGALQRADLPRAERAQTPAGGSRRRAAGLVGAAVVIILGVGAAVMLTRTKPAQRPAPAAAHSISVRVADGSATFIQTVVVSEGRQGNFVGPIVSPDGRARRQTTFNVQMEPEKSGSGDLDVTYQLDVSGEAPDGTPWIKVQGEVALRPGGGLTTVECGRWTIGLSLDDSGAGRAGEAAGGDDYRVTAELTKDGAKTRCREVLKLGAQGNVESGVARADKKPRFTFNHALTPLAGGDSVNIEYQLEYRPNGPADLVQVQNQETLLLGRPSRSQVSGGQLELLAERLAPRPPLAGDPR